MGYQLFKAQVVSATQLSPHWMRVVFTGEDFAECGSADPIYDVRIKILFPHEGKLPNFPDNDISWLTKWRATKDETLDGNLRTYSVRKLERDAGGTVYMTVDFVLHLAEHATGPAATWALNASPGDEVIIGAPRYDDTVRGGIEFSPGDASTVYLVGDETAVPAVSRILEDLADNEGIAYQGSHPLQVTAFLEVPEEADILPGITLPENCSLQWFARGERPHGELLTAKIKGLFGENAADSTSEARTPAAHVSANKPANESAGDAYAESAGEQDRTRTLLWETPHFSSSNEPLPSEKGSGAIYYWIAGESGFVTNLRRYLTREQNIDRKNVSFMGYWKHGVALD